MATVPNPRTWTVGELLTAAKMNTDLRDGLNFLLSKPLCKLRQNVGINIGSANITWPTEVIDRDNGHSTVSNTDRYTVQTAGWYHVICNVEWVDAFTAGEARIISIGAISAAGSTMGSTTAGALSLGTGNNAVACVSGMFAMAVGDYFTANTIISGAGTELVSNGTSFCIEWISKNP